MKYTKINQMVYIFLFFRVPYRWLYLGGGGGGGNISKNLIAMMF